MIVEIYHDGIWYIFAYIKNLWFKSLSNYLLTYILKDDSDKNNDYIFDIEYLLSVR